MDIRVLHYSVAQGADTRHTSVPELATFGSWSGWAWQRIAPTWIEARPVEALSAFESDQAVHLLLLRNPSDHDDIVCVYPVSSANASCNLIRSPSGLVLNLRRADNGSAGGALVIGTASEARAAIRLVDQVVLAARAWLESTPVDRLQPFKPFPSGGPFDRVGFCTWSSIGEDIRLDRDNLSALFDSLVANQVPVQSFVLDDGWQNSATYAKGDAGGKRSKTGPEADRGTWQLRGLWDFDCHEGLGRDGLVWVVTEAKLRFAQTPGVNESVEVGVWLALTGGYWDGIHPDSPLINRYDCRPYRVKRARLPGVPNEPFTPGYLPAETGVYYLPPPTESLRFWRDWFKYLHNSGVSFLKVDNQGSLSLLDGAEGLECQNALWKDMVQASDEIFGRGRVIHCMSHHESMYGGSQGLGLDTDGERFVWRNSDDFGLVGKRDNYQQMHIFTNITNAILGSSLCMVLDADMFMTAKLDPIPHALLRAVFPGPLLLSDRPGEHDLSLLQRLIAMDKSGTARVIKTSHPATPLANRVFDLDIMGTKPGRGLWASAPAGDGYIIGVWNVRDDELEATVEDALTSTDLSNVLGGRDHQRWILARQNLVHGGFTSASLWSGQNGNIDKVQLIHMEAASYWATPAWQVRGCDIGILGLINHFAGLSAVKSVNKDKGRLNFEITGQGTLGLLVISDHHPSLSILIDGTAYPMVFEALTGFIGNVDHNTRWLGTVDITGKVGGVDGPGWLIELV